MNSLFSRKNGLDFLVHLRDTETERKRNGAQNKMEFWHNPCQTGSIPLTSIQKGSINQPNPLGTPVVSKYGGNWSLMAVPKCSGNSKRTSSAPPPPRTRLELAVEMGGQHVGGQPAGPHVHPAVLRDLPAQEVRPVGDRDALLGKREFWRVTCCNLISGVCECFMFKQDLQDLSWGETAAHRRE